MTKKYYLYENGFWGELQVKLILLAYITFWIIIAEVIGLVIANFFLTINYFLTLKINGIIVIFVLFGILIKSLFAVRYYMITEKGLVVKYNSGKNKFFTWNTIKKINYYIEKEGSFYRIFTGNSSISISHIPFEEIEQKSLEYNIELIEDYNT